MQRSAAYLGALANALRSALFIFILSIFMVIPGYRDPEEYIYYLNEKEGLIC